MRNDAERKPSVRRVKRGELESERGMLLLLFGFTDGGNLWANGLRLIIEWAAQRGRIWD